MENLNNSSLSVYPSLIETIALGYFDQIEKLTEFQPRYKKIIRMSEICEVWWLATKKKYIYILRAGIIKKQDTIS